MRNISIKDKYAVKKGRVTIIYLLLIISAIALGYKLINMNTVEHGFLKKQGDGRADRNIKINAFRGTIADRNGLPLAISTPVDSIWLNPYYLDSDDIVKLKQIFVILNLSGQEKEKLLNWTMKRLGKHGFRYIARKINPDLAVAVKKIDLKGVEIKREYKRFYPEGETTSQVVGFTDIDNQGQEGMELLYNEWLDSKTGLRKVYKDAKGNHVRNRTDNIEAKNGENLILSIDRDIQYIAYRSLKNAVQKANAVGGSVVIMDIKTGEVVAMTNQPSYNPNNMKTAFPENRRNRAVTDVLEPGSVMKAIAGTAALKSGIYTADSIIKTSPGYYKIGKNTVRDFRDYGDLDLETIFMKSSNVGISKMILSLEDKNYYPDFIRDIGFGSKTGIEFPGERSGIVPVVTDWKDFPLATLTFGYGMNATPLQITSSFATLANHGKRLQPTLLKVNSLNNISFNQVVSAEIADTVVEKLRSVVERLGGTATKAQVKGYTVAGKTGTTRKSIAGGYSKNSYMAVFAGIIPASNPVYAAVVVIDDAKGTKYGGGSVAAPVFSTMMSQIMRIKNIQPDGSLI